MNDDETRDDIAEFISAAAEHDLDAAGFARLNALILESMANAHVCVEELDLQAALVETMTAEDTVEIITRTMARPRRRAASGGRRTVMIASTLTAAAIGFALLAVSFIDLRSPIVATVRSLSGDAVLAGGGDVGSLIRAGERLKITSGVVTLEDADGVSVDLRGPTTLAWRERGGVELVSGLLRATVPPAGVGFTVRTEHTEVVDLGTEFVVEHRLAEDTRVGVRRGKVEAYTLDEAGARQRVTPLVAGETAVLTYNREVVAGVTDELFGWFDRHVGRLRSVGGAARLAPATPADVSPGGTVTRGYVLVIPERRDIVLTEPLTVGAGESARTLPAGRALRSYLVHFDPHLITGRAPKGTLHFGGPVAAVLGDVASLQSTDRRFGLSEVRYGGGIERGLEAGDVATTTPDGRVVRFNFDVELGSKVKIDQIRVLTYEDA